MYDIKDKPAAIRRVQRMLNLNENGNYDVRTREEVLAHQRNNSLAESGKVDYETFVSILDEYRMNVLKREVTEKIPFKNEFPYSKGDIGDGPNILNTMLRHAIDALSLDLQKPRGPYFSDASASAVSELRKIFMLGDADYIDEVFYDKLLKL